MEPEDLDLDEPQIHDAFTSLSAAAAADGGGGGGSPTLSLEKLSLDETPNSLNPNPNPNPKPYPRHLSVTFDASNTFKKKRNARAGPPFAAQNAEEEKAIEACKGFFGPRNKSRGISGDESMDFEFLVGLFDKDPDLTEFYRNGRRKGRFCCLVCQGFETQKSKRFWGCGTLMKHAVLRPRTTRRGVEGAHRALRRAVKRVMGWD